MSAVPVTLKNRIVSLDVIRGIAVLGILLANIVAFAVPILQDRQTMELPTDSLDAWIEVFRQWFVAGKFRGMLAMLFGVGLHLQFVKRFAQGNWPGGYVRRTIFLAAIGLCHAIFIWFGDILFMYACVALLAMLFAKVQDRFLMYWIGGLAGIAFFIGVGLTALIAIIGGSPEGSDAALGPLKPFLGEAGELRTYASGSYLDQVLLRAIVFAVSLFQIAFMVPSLLALFLGGMLLARHGFLAKPSAHPKIQKYGRIALGVGVVLNAIPVGLYAAGVKFNVGFVIEFSLSMILAFGYISLLANWIERWPNWWRLFQNVGRMALTCYLLQSVLCTTIFYSWGLGWFNRLNYAEMLIVVGIVWAIEIIFAALWFRRFAIGPVERFWRMASERTRVPWRVSATEPTTTPPVA